MIVSPHQDDFQGFNRDGSNGMPYVAHLPNHTELYLVMPIREWNEPPEFEERLTSWVCLNGCLVRSYFWVSGTRNWESSGLSVFVFR